MAKYFNYFPKEYYYLNDDSKSLDIVTNITSKFKFEDEFKNNTVVYYQYEIEDGETPEIIAYKVYGSTEKHWIILALNDIINPQMDWPIEQNSLIKLIDKKYQSAEYANNTTTNAGKTWAQTNIHSYYKIETQTNNLNQKKFINKIEVDANTYANVTSSSDVYTLQSGQSITIDITKETKTYLQYEIEKNDSKRTIKLLKNEFIDSVENEFKRVISQ